MDITEKIELFRRLAERTEAAYWASIDVPAEWRQDGSVDHLPFCYRCEGTGLIEVSSHDLPVLCRECEGLGGVSAEYNRVVRTSDALSRLLALYQTRRMAWIERQLAVDEALELIEAAFGPVTLVAS